jgi:hypothetical protein
MVIGTVMDGARRLNDISHLLNISFPAGQGSSLRPPSQGLGAPRSLGLWPDGTAQAADDLPGTAMTGNQRALAPTPFLPATALAHRDRAPPFAEAGRRQRNFDGGRLRSVVLPSPAFLLVAVWSYGGLIVMLPS